MRTSHLVSPILTVSLAAALGAVPVGAQIDRTARVTWLEGALRDSATETHWVNLQAGVGYVVSGTCDDDCTDLDVQIFSPGENVVAEDFRSDRRATVAFMAGRSGRYRVDVKMATCLQAPCTYAVAIVNQ